MLKLHWLEAFVALVFANLNSKLLIMFAVVQFFC